MRILAYCDSRYVEATRKVIGGVDALHRDANARVLTSPPCFAGDVDPLAFSDQDLIYIDLHGIASSVYLYSGPGQLLAALSIERVRQMNLGGAVVFATTCFLPQTPFVQAFLEAHARAVICGDGENFGGRARLIGAQRLALHVIDALAKGADVDEALGEAKQRLRWSMAWLFDKTIKDALQFRVFRAWHKEVITYGDAI